MKLNIAVIFGGRSVEHEISIISALQAMAAIDQEKYQITPIYIAKTGEWYTGKELLVLENYRDLDQLLNKSTNIIVDQNNGRWKIYYKLSKLFGGMRAIPIDLVLPITHGTHGEDGTLQGLLTTMNIPYAGCDTLASAITMDKVVTKMLLQAMGIKVVDYLWFYAAKWLDSKDQVVAAIKNKFTYPLIVKPGNLGSSIGVMAVQDDNELEDAIDLAVSMSQKFLVEPKITNLKEVNCAVLGDRDGVEVSICEEPIRSAAILSYQDKYCGGSKGKLEIKGGAKNITQGGMNEAQRKIPADIPEATAKQIQELAKQSFIGLDCNGVARIDFLIDQSNHEIYLCELNSIPGSLSFYLWEPTGKTFTALLDRLFELALKRHRENNNLIVFYTKNILNPSN
jgi:D-alanine-D-alanine ligase